MRLLRALEVRRAVLRLRPDIVNVHMSPTGPTALALRHLPRLVVTVWGSDVVWHGGREPAGRRFWLRFALRQARAVTAASRFLAERARSLSGDGTVDIVPFGVDCEQFSPRKEGHAEAGAARQVRIGFVKHLERIYGPDILLRAFAHIADDGPDLRLVIVGDGSERGQLQELAGMLGVAGRVEFRGHLPHEEVPRVLSSLSVFAMPTVCEEGFGVAALEASAMELPVVASRLGGIPEVVVDGETGVLVAPGNVEALAGALKRLITDPEAARRMGDAGRRFVLSSYTWERSVEAMEAVYARVAGRGDG